MHVDAMRLALRHGPDAGRGGGREGERGAAGDEAAAAQADGLRTAGASAEQR